MNMSDAPDQGNAALAVFLAAICALAVVAWLAVR